MGTINPLSILGHDLLCTEKFNIIASFRNRILIPIASESWTRMRLEILVPIHAPYRHFSNFWVLKKSDFIKQKFLDSTGIKEKVTTKIKDLFHNFEKNLKVTGKRERREKLTP